jgi:DNA mismatch repair protein MutS2
MKQMMKLCGNRSLLLIDEFGGGTEPQIGGALAEAILNHFVHDGAYGVITTHYQNLKTFAQKQYSVVNGAMLYDRHQMQPLYILQIGNPGSSFAIEIARKIGLPEDVIDYAANIVGNEYIMSDKYLQDIVRDKVYWENKRKNIHQKEKELDKSIANYQEEMQSFQREKKAVMAQAKEEAKILLEESNAKIENTIREIKEAQAEKERTQDARKKLNEFKERALESSE